MCSITFLGSLDGCIRAKKNQEKWEETLTRLERIEIILQVILYFIALVATVLAGFFDMYIYYYKVSTLITLSSRITVGLF